MRKLFILITGIFLILMNYSCSDRRQDVIGGAILSDLARPTDGRCMRTTSTKTGENGKPIPHNSDNSRVMPGETKVLLDARGPGVVTHMWFTFLGSERLPGQPMVLLPIRKCYCGSFMTEEKNR